MIQGTITWHRFPEERPPALCAGQYERYLVAVDAKVTECSWLFGGWHLRHDGCSEITGLVHHWAELPKAPTP